MKVIGWTGWDDPRYPDDYGDDPLLEERKNVVIEELRKHNYHISGYYHQGGKRGVPVFDDGNWLRISFRSWGQIMADAYPEEMAQAKSAYIVWAWCSPCDPKDMTIPAGRIILNMSYGKDPFRWMITGSSDIFPLLREANRKFRHFFTLIRINGEQSDIMMKWRFIR